MEWFWTELVGRWWGKLIISLIPFFLVYAVFHDFARYERGESIRVPWYIALTYNIGGKWTVAAPFALVGILLVWAGIRQYRNPED